MTGSSNLFLIIFTQHMPLPLTSAAHVGIPFIYIDRGLRLLSPRNQDRRRPAEVGAVEARMMVVREVQSQKWSLVRR